MSLVSGVHLGLYKDNRILLRHACYDIRTVRAAVLFPVYCFLCRHQFQVDSDNLR